MKAGRLTRKTHLKRHLAPTGDIAVYDLTSKPEQVDFVLALADLGHDGALDSEEISSLPLAFARPDDILHWCADTIAESPAAGRLWAEAQEDGWSVGFADLKTGGFYLDMARKSIMLDHFSLSPSALGRSPYFRNALLATFIRSLRDIWHERTTGAFDAVYLPEDVLMLERVRAADCDTVTLLATWELRGAGFADVWRHMIGSEEGDMALVFTRHLERDPAALFDGSALAYAFRQWFADEIRVDAADHVTLEALDDLLLNECGRFGDKRCDIAMIESLSELPDGIRYLRGLGHTVKEDPFFAGLGDPINQTHLFHLIYDTEVTMVNNVPFRDAKLARMIFPKN